MTVERVDGLFAGEAMAFTSLIDPAAFEELSAGERALVANSVSKRQLEFATVRKLARLAFTGLGLPAAEILNDADRAPIWPDGVSGSLSHCSTRACAVVGRRTDIGTVGIDVEDRAVLATGLWPRILDDAEREFVEQQPSDERGRIALMMFSAKEAFYKAQYPRSRTFLAFREVRLEEVRRTGDLAGTFSIRLLREVPNIETELFPGQFREIGAERTIATAVQIRESLTSPR